MRFEWDERKNASNFRKHGVEFEVASEVFSDPFASYAQDQFVGGEARVRITGMAGGHLLVVVFVSRAHKAEEGDEIVRIISARRANRQERRDFEGGA